MKIIVTGGNGQLGQVFGAMEDESAHTFILVGRDQLDITDRESIARFLDANPGDCIMNAAAYTAVDKAEEDVDMANLVNGTAAGILSRACADRNMDFIHFSTDYVFDGKGDTPYTEEDPVNPQGMYGASKLLGEQQVMESNPAATILRVSWLVSDKGNNFIKTMVRLGRERDELTIVDDQVASPTNGYDLAQMAIRIAEKKAEGNHKLSGIFHFTHSGECSWRDFAEYIFTYLEIDCRALSTTTAAYGAPAPRPLYSKLSTAKLESVLNWQPRDWKEGMSDLLMKL